MDTIPIPRDIPLPLPAPTAWLDGLLVVAFIAHILFVNLIVGGSALVFFFELRGRRHADFDRLARELASTVTVNKSLAVVLGVAPLLTINVLYTMHFYTANALTGTAWLLLIPAIATTFLLLYLHKYSWDRLAAHKRWHLAILGAALALLAVIPLVFLANVNLMLLPERWTSVRGFLDAVLLPNVFPRYFHFLCASLILTSLFGVGYFGRDAFPVETTFQTLTRPALRRVFYTIALRVSLLQFCVGPLVLFTLPRQGLVVSVAALILLGAAVAVGPVWLMWRELQSPSVSGRHLPLIVGGLGITVFCMALGRHSHRIVALADHQRAMHVATENWVGDAEQAAYDLELLRARESAGISEGQHVFQSVCAACHAVDRQLVGPALTEISQLYASNPAGIVAWARAPGRKRPSLQPMPAFDALGDAKLRQAADYMLELGSKAREGTRTMSSSEAAPAP
jgi:cytochrome c